MANGEDTPNPYCRPNLLGPISHTSYTYNCTDVNVYWCCHMEHTKDMHPFRTSVTIHWAITIIICVFSVLSNVCSFVIFNQRDYKGKSIPAVLQMKYVAIIGLALSTPFMELVKGYFHYSVVITSVSVCNGLEFFLEFCSTLCNWSELFVSCFRFARNVYPVKTFIYFHARKPAFVAAHVAVLIAIVCSIHILVRPSYSNCLSNGQHFCAWRPNPAAQRLLFIVGYFIPIMVSLTLLILLRCARNSTRRRTNSNTSETNADIPRRAYSLSFTSSAIFFVSNFPLLMFKLVSMNIEESNMGCRTTFQQAIAHDVLSSFRLLGLSLDYVVYLAISPPLRRHTCTYIRSRMRSIESFRGRPFTSN